MPLKGHLETLFSAIDQGYCLCEMIHDAEGHAVDYRFLEVNPLFEQMTGLRHAHGRTARELVPGLERHWIDTYAAVAAGTPRRFQNGSEAMGRWFDVFATPVEPAGRFVLVFRDITAQHLAETQREEARAQAERLLAELNHRVMNTLSMVGSIMRIEARALVGDSAGAQSLVRLQTRVAALSALYRALGEVAATERVDAAPYLAQVVRSIENALVHGARITVAQDIAPVPLRTEVAAPLGLLVNELMTNALKYAFPDDRPGRLTVTLARLGTAEMELTVADDGIGVAAAGARTDRQDSTGIGSTLIEGFAQQLGGTLTRETSERGTTVRVRFAESGLLA